MADTRFSGVKVHPTALIEEGVSIGQGSSIWDNVHIRHGAAIGKSCIIGEKSYIAYDVRIGDYCKLNASVYVCAQVEIGDFVMLAAQTVFTNDRFPRAFEISLDGLASSDPNEETLWTRVGKGVTTGANVTIGPGLTLGDFAMVGMGSVVTRDIPEHGLVIGNPAKLVAYLCACGPVVARHEAWQRDPDGAQYCCARCGRIYERVDAGVKEIHGPTSRGHH
jgi:acetyltransferase-like isoleucine patch superfamily enzyme